MESGTLLRRPSCALVVLLAAVAAAPVAAQGLPQRLNDTGQVTCYAGSGGGSTPIPCNGSTVASAQDANAGRDDAASGGTLVKIGAGAAGFDFTKLAADGAVLPAGAGAPQWRCTRDNVTGLVWRTDVDLVTGWEAARAVASSFSATALCGRGDWRLPDTAELLGLVHFDEQGPAVDTGYFPATPPGAHWSAQRDRQPEAIATRAWSVDFGAGFATTAPRSGTAAVRAVAGGGAGAVLVDHGDGTVSDMQHGLMWTRCALGQSGAGCAESAEKHGWSQAMDAARSRNAANWLGHADWRVPNAKELATLVDRAHAQPAIDATMFPGTAPAAHWTTTSYAPDAHAAWAVFFGSGDLLAYDKRAPARVRLVRTVPAAATALPRDALFEAGFDLPADPPPPATTLPQVVIATDGGVPITSTETYVNASMTITLADGSASYAGTLRIRGRGNSTWGMPKKPYRLKLDQRAGLLGMPAHKDWNLLANYADKSLLRTATAFQLGERLGMAWTPRTRMVTLRLNGDEVGTYQLVEKIEVDPARVAIDELDDDDISPEVVSGGYLLEIDSRRDCEVLFETPRDVPVCVQAPGHVPAVPQQLDYIAGYLRDTEDAIHAATFADPATGYAAWIDVDSFIDWFLVNELFRNQDAASYSSIWQYKPRGGKLFRGPLWDYDLAAGNVDYGVGPDPEGWHIRHGIWYARLFQDPAFASRVRMRWQAVRAQHIDTLPAWIEASAAGLGSAPEANFARWPILDRYVWPNPVFAGSHAGEVGFVKDWLRQRIAWLDANL